MAQKRMERNSMEYGEKGEGKIVELDALRARVDFKQADGSFKAFNINVVQGNPFEEETATLPSYFPWSAMRAESSIPVRARLDASNSRVMSVNPLSGEFVVRFVGFKKVNDVAVMETKQGRGGKPYRSFTPFLEVMEGRWKGCRFIGTLYDNFGKDPEDGMTTILGSGTGSDNLADFMDCLGYEYWTKPYSENPLPAIEAFTTQSPRQFKIMVVNGWVSNYIPGFDDEVFGEDEATDARLDAVSNPEETDNVLD